MEISQMLSVKLGTEDAHCLTPRGLTYCVMQVPAHTKTHTHTKHIYMHTYTQTQHTSTSMHIQGHVNCNHWDRSARQPSLLPVFLEMKLCQRQ